MNKRILEDRYIAKVIDDLESMHPEARCALDHSSTYELIVAVALSAQTTDVSVNKITPALFARYPSPAELAAANQGEVEEMIKTIGLYKNKAANIIKLAQKLVEDYDSEVPDSYEELISLPGVGRKTANVVLAEAFGVPRIAVDTHVFRVSNRIGLTDAKDVLGTEKELMARVPREDWIGLHHLLIFHGRKTCIARKPRCEECRLSELCLHHSQETEQNQ